MGTTAPVQGVVAPIAITLSPAGATIADNAPRRDRDCDGRCHDVGRPSISTLTTTARAYKAANDGAHSTVITASQGGQSISMGFSV